MKLQSLTVGFLVAAVVTAVGCKHPGAYNLPPAERLMHPGPGVDGPGPGVMVYGDAMPMMMPGMTPPSSQIAFIGPDGMAVAWDVSAPGMFDSEPLIAPGRQNFYQGAIYRLKLTNVPGRPGIELYPTLEVGTATPRTDAFLAHNAIPVQITPEDFDQILSGNFVTKVIYLPDPEFQELALAGVETLVSTRLEPGVDPIVEADRRGAILAIFRIGNKDLQSPAGGFMGEGVMPASHNGGVEGQPAGYYNGPVGMPGAPMGMPTAAFAPAAYPPNFVSGVTGPQYGMPMSGTPIGLPGPPHVPLGVPAGLQRHTMVNHTHHHLPKPVEKFRIDAKQKPGFSYPKPVSHVQISDHTHPHHVNFENPLWNTKETVVDPNCPPGH